MKGAVLNSMEDLSGSRDGGSRKSRRAIEERNRASAKSRVEIQLRMNSKTAYFRLGNALNMIIRRTERSPLVSQSITRGAETEVFSKLLRDLFRVGKARTIFPLPSPPHFDSFYAPHFTQGTTTRAGLSLSQ